MVERWKFEKLEEWNCYPFTKKGENRLDSEFNHVKIVIRPTILVLLFQLIGSN